MPPPAPPRAASVRARSWAACTACTSAPRKRRPGILPPFNLREHGVDAILAEQELAFTMNRHALARLGYTAPGEGDVRLQAV